MGLYGESDDISLSLSLCVALYRVCFLIRGRTRLRRVALIAECAADMECGEIASRLVPCVKDFDMVNRWVLHFFFLW